MWEGQGEQGQWQGQGGAASRGRGDRHLPSSDDTDGTSSDDTDGELDAGRQVPHDGDGGAGDWQVRNDTAIEQLTQEERATLVQDCQNQRPQNTKSTFDGHLNKYKVSVQQDT